MAAALAACVTATAPSSLLPTHQHSQIDLLNRTRGLLYRTGHCVLMRSAGGPIVPIWPSGTKISNEGLVLPPANGGAFLRFDRVAYLSGGYIEDPARLKLSLPARRTASTCGVRGFLVNRAQSEEAMEAASPRPRYTSGLLVRKGTCLVLENVDGVLLPVWPAGTVITDRTVVTPNLRGHAPLAIGGRAGLQGRYVRSGDGSLQRAAGAESGQCAQRGMIVERANRVYLANSAAENAAMSDAVLVLELVELNSSEPLHDGFLTTIAARIVEPLTGRFGGGETIKLRHPSGRDPAGGWRGATHDPVFASLGQTRLKPGDRLLLFVNQDFYRQMAEARGGRPVAGFVGTGGGIYVVEDGRIINEGGMRMPETLDKLRLELQGRQPFDRQSTTPK